MRLIDADKIRIFYAPIAPFSAENDVHYEPIAYAWEIDRLPTVDAEPVIHAHWIPCEYEIGEGSNVYKCSHCGTMQVLIDGTPKDNGWRYCPSCGAKMDANA